MGSPRWLAVVALSVVCTACARCGSARSSPPAARKAELREDIDPPAASGSMAPYLLVSDGEVFLSWLEPSQRAGEGPRPTSMRVARLGEDGWTEPVTVASGEKVLANWADFPSLAAGSDGSLFAHWAESSGKGPYAYDVALARSANRGVVWARLGLANDDGVQAEHGFVSMVPGNPLRAFWLDGRKTAGSDHGHAGPGAAMTLRTAAVDSGISPSEELDGRVCDCCQTSAAVAAEGPLVVFRDRAEDETRDISIIRFTGGKWTEPRRVHGDGWRVPGCPVNGPKVVARGRDVAVAWYTYAGSVPRIRLAFSRTSGAEFGPPVEVDGPAGRSAPVGRVDLAWLDGDQVVVSWLASDRENATWQARRVAFDGRMAAPVTLANTRADRDSGFPRLVRAGDALVAAWTEGRSPSRVRARRIPLERLPASLQDTAAAGAPPAAPGRDLVGELVPDVRATTAAGTASSLRQLAGRPVLLNLWATWCESCRFELPELTALFEKFRETDLRVIALSVDRERTREEVASFAARRKLPFEIWHDPDDRVSEALGAALLPTSYLLGRDGKVLWKHSGALSASDPEVVAAVERALRATPR